MRNRLLMLIVALVCVSLQACVLRGCGDVGGVDGVRVDVPKSLYIPTGRLTVTVCSDQDCASAFRRFEKPPGAAPASRALRISFADLARAFKPGQVTMTVELRGSHGQLVAERTQTISLRRYYPNGKECDGDGYVSGGLALRRGDRV